MKHFLPLVFAFFALSALAQTVKSEFPPSFSEKYLTTNVDSRFIPKPDMSLTNYLDSMDSRMSNPYRFAINIPVKLSMKNSGTWTELPDQNGRIWRLNINCPGARALGLYYSSFYLPSGSGLFIYSADKKHLVGALTDEINPESGLFATEEVPGENITLEYFEPYGISQEAIINIQELEYIYRGVATDNDKSGTCEVNINCSPEGTSWQDEKKGVCRLDIKIGTYSYLCSGSLVNNTGGDCTPYVLTADHCTYDGDYVMRYANASEMAQWKFKFHYEATTCTGTAASGTITKTGCTLKAHDTYGSGGAGSDFCLVQMSQAATGSNLYFNGWSRSTTGPASGASIHHPDGDIMKISTFTTGLSPSGTHWEVTWAATTNGHGVTEPGSSGSPIFNSTGLIVGTLTGGTSFCTAPNDPDYYGRFSYHWSSNGSTSAKQLKPWLDPLNSSPASLAGSYTCTPASIKEANSLNTSVNLYPNPASAVLTVSLGEKQVKNATVRIYSLVGELVFIRTWNNITQNELNIDVRMQPSGLYFLSLETGNTVITKKFAIQH